MSSPKNNTVPRALLDSWLDWSDSVANRISCHISFLDSLVRIMFFALEFVKSDQPDHFGYETAKNVTHVGARVVATVLWWNPVPWSKFQKQQFGEPESRKESAPWKFRELAIDLMKTEPKQRADGSDWGEKLIKSLVGMVYGLSIVLGEYVPVQVDDRKVNVKLPFKFKPLPENRQDWTQGLRAAVLLAGETFRTDDIACHKDFCDVCNASGDLKRCSRCLAARYCSTDCQRNDYKYHKSRCFVAHRKEDVKRAYYDQTIDETKFGRLRAREEAALLLDREREQRLQGAQAQTQQQERRSSFDMLELD